MVGLSIAGSTQTHPILEREGSAVTARLCEVAHDTKSPGPFPGLRTDAVLWRRRHVAADDPDGDLRGAIDITGSGWVGGAARRVLRFSGRQWLGKGPDRDGPVHVFGAHLECERLHRSLARVATVCYRRGSRAGSALWPRFQLRGGLDDHAVRQ